MLSKFDTSTMEIPINQIKIGQNIKNIRTVFNRDRIEELADGIQRDGLMTPLIVMGSEDEDDNPIIELIAGERRYRAIQLIRKRNPTFMEEVPCIHFEGTIHDATFVNVAENIDREQVDEVDLSSWLYERVQDGVTQSELATRLHRSAQWVSFRITFFDRACEELKKALREGLISFTAAYYLAKNCSAEEQVKYIDKARRNEEKISLNEAKSSGSDKKSTTPGKKERTKMAALAEKIASESGSDVARGVSLGLSWVDGLIPASELEEMLTFEGGK